MALPVSRSFLVDLNVWLALLVIEHIHHSRARSWFDSLDAGQAGLCRPVQFGLMRLLSNRAIMHAGALSGAAAWQLVHELMDDERVVFHPEPAGIDSALPGLLKYNIPTGKLITDAYFAAFAIKAGLTFVTYDRGFVEFPGLSLKLLEA